MIADAGWERRFIADEARVAELVRIYEELGYEILVEPVSAGDLDEGCHDCWLVAQQRLKVIYTRPSGTSHGT